jgi:hypothetical protein
MLNLGLIMHKQQKKHPKLLRQQKNNVLHRLVQGKADGGALFVVTTCLSIICLGLAFVGGNIPEKFPKTNPNGAAPGQILSAPAQNTLQLLTFKAILPKLIPTIDPNAPPLSTDKQLPTPAGTGPGSASPSGAGTSGCTPAGPNDPEPPADYTRTTYGGKTVNQRTKVMLQTAEKYAGVKFTLTQGSYSTGVAASAGTHDGGGAGDISVGGMSRAQIDKSIQGLRMAGFAAWYRTPAEGFAVHIHFEAIGDKEMSSGGRDQVVDLFAGRNGLANNGRDSAPASIGRPFPAWAGKYGTCT